MLRIAYCVRPILRSTQYAVSAILLTGTEGGAAVLFGFGVAGASWIVGQTYRLDLTENPGLAWDWLDRVPMIGKPDILLDKKSSACDCQ